MNTTKNILLGLGFFLCEKLLGNLVGMIIGILFGISAGVYSVSHGVEVQDIVHSSRFIITAALCSVPFEYLIGMYLLKKIGKKISPVVFNTFYVISGFLAWIFMLTSEPEYAFVPLVVIMVVCLFVQPKFVLNSNIKVGA